MSRIDEIFAQLRQDDQRAVMPFVTGGHPVGSDLGGVLRGLQAGGASIAEVGIPFSDPIADGPVIAAAMHEALTSGATPGSVMDAVAAARESLSMGLVAMVSVSIVTRMGGPAGFVERASEAGFDGFIFPDAPLEESGDLIAAAAEKGCSASLLISPSTPAKRAAAIAEACTGFVYLVARAGITGERDDAPEIESRVRTIRDATDTPIACGFGISTPDQVRAVVEHADAAIVGSALVRRLTESEDPAGEAERFTRELAGGLSASAAP